MQKVQNFLIIIGLGLMLTACGGGAVTIQSLPPAQSIGVAISEALLLAELAQPGFLGISKIIIHQFRIELRTLEDNTITLDEVFDRLTERVTEIQGKSIVLNDTSFATDYLIHRVRNIILTIAGGNPQYDIADKTAQEAIKILIEVVDTVDKNLNDGPQMRPVSSSVG